MSRYFAPITPEALKQKMFEALKKNWVFEANTWDDLWIDKGGFTTFDIDALRTFCQLTPQISKDLKIHFDTENVFGMEQDRLLGFRTLENGLTFCGFEAGGDWEFPVFFIIYWDGKQLRGYVPSDGNMWNTDSKQAYGNNEVKDQKNLIKRFPELKTYDFAYYGTSSIIDNLSTDYELIQKDIETRILPLETKPIKSHKIRKAKKQPNTELEKSQEQYRITLNALKRIKSLGYKDVTSIVTKALEKAAKYN